MVCGLTSAAAPARISVASSDARPGRRFSAPFESCFGCECSLSKTLIGLDER